MKQPIIKQEKKEVFPTVVKKSLLEKNRKNYILILAVASMVMLLATVLYMQFDANFSIAEVSRIINPNDNKLNEAPPRNTGKEIFDTMTEKVMPSNGFQSKVKLDDVVMKLVKADVIDPEKFTAIYQNRGGLPAELKDILTTPQQNPMHLTIGNANVYVNLLWPLGLSNYMSSNKKSPINGERLFNFASTGGWNLGKEKNGGAYFNKLKIVELTTEQEALVTKIAQNTYRPCCNNSTFFQDCNHGSALLGLIELAVSQGLSEDEIYKEALAFNGFWFPDKYIQTAVYYKAVKNIDWENVDPKVVIGKDFSSISGWRQNVNQELINRNLIPQNNGGGSRCGA